MKLRTKFSIPLIVLIISVSILLNYLFIRAEEKRLKSYIKKFGISLAKNLSSNSEFGVLVGSKAELKQPVESIAVEKDVVFAFVLDTKKRGTVLAHNKEDEVGRVYNDTHSLESLNSNEILIRQYIYDPATGEEILDISVPVFNEFKKKIRIEDPDLYGEELFSENILEEEGTETVKVKNGVARVGLSLTPLHNSISTMKRKVVIITLCMIFVILIVLTSLIRVVTQPVLTLVEAAKKIAAGNYTHTVKIDSGDEIGVLAKSFNHMSLNLFQSMKRMELTSDFNRSLISANNLDELLETVLYEILNARKIRDGAIMFFDNKRKRFVVKGTEAFLGLHLRLSRDEMFLEWFKDHKKVVNIEDYLEWFASDMSVEYDKLKNLGVSMIIPLHAKDEVIGIFSFGKKMSGEEFSESNIRFLSNLTQSAVIAIENIVLREKEAENEILKFELEFAKRVQKSLLPHTNPEIKGLDIHTLCIPAKDVGGDYYDFIELKEGGYGISIADVSGKGVPAALYMASTRGFLRSVALDDRSSHDTLSKINELLYEVCGAKTFVTMFYAVIDSESRRFTYANAGHAYPLLYKLNGNGRANCSYLSNNGLPLGVAVSQNYASDSITLNPGELVLFYTDGIVEAMNDSRELFGFERLEELVKKYGHLSAKEFVDNTMRELRIFIGDNPLQDDLTLVAMRVMD
jgi:serine phosphatase RsbU (regulator of sigma subunit)/HAMP domain-containing protein